MNLKAHPARWLSAAGAAFLAGCIAVPDYSRTETVTRFEAIAIAELPHGRAAYLVNRCTDRPDRLEACSEFGDHGQFITVQPRGWRIERRFEPSSGDLTLSDDHGSKYAAYLRPEAGASTGEGEIALGDFIRLEWGATRSHTVRVWWRAEPAAGLRALTLDAVPQAGAAGQDLADAADARLPGGVHRVPHRHPGAAARAHRARATGRHSQRGLLRRPAVNAGAAPAGFPRMHMRRHS